MITNERQYKVTKAEIIKFQEALEAFDEDVKTATNIHPIILNAQRQALEFKLKELLEEIREYEDIKDGRILINEVFDIKDLPVCLIKARIANGLTQKELAHKLDMQEQQIQRYEGTKYESVSLKTLFRISDVLGVKLSGDMQLKAIKSPEEINIKNYPFRQMFQRNWFAPFSDSFNEAAHKSSELLHELFEKAGMAGQGLVLNKSSLRIKSNYNDYALKAWYARVRIKADEQIIVTKYKRSLLTEDWIANLSSLSQQKRRA